MLSRVAAAVWVLVWVPPILWYFPLAVSIPPPVPSTAAVRSEGNTKQPEEGLPNTPAVEGPPPITASPSPAEQNSSVPTPPPVPLTPVPSADDAIYRRDENGTAHLLFRISELKNFPANVNDFEKPFGEDSLKFLILAIYHTGATCNKSSHNCEKYGNRYRMARFLASLRRAGSKALVVVFCRVASMPSLEHLLNRRYRNVRIIGYEDNAIHKGLWVSSLRHVLSHVFLSRLPHTFEGVMTADLFDVIFQEDPLELLRARRKFWMEAAKKGITRPSFLPEYLKQEESVEKLDSSNEIIIAAQETAELGGPTQSDQLNKKWYNECRGDPWALAPKRKLNVLCSGTTLGTPQAMLRYLYYMDHLARSIPSCGGHGRDQGAHNVILYNKPELVSILDFHPSEELEEEAESEKRGLLVRDSTYGGGSKILTINDMPVVRLNEKRELVNEYGELFALFHQVNRCFHIHRYYLMSGRDAKGAPLFERRSSIAGKSDEVIKAFKKRGHRGTVFQLIEANREIYSCLDIEYPSFLPFEATKTSD